MSRYKLAQFTSYYADCILASTTLLSDSPALVAQDIAVVPFLVLLPVVENADLVGQPNQSTMTLVASLGPTALQTLLGLGALLLGGRIVLRRIFEMVRFAFCKVCIRAD
jgi:hypothetical protein